jgi:hypothetical protein
VAFEDALPYDEPAGWMVPSRHALATLLLDAADQADQAAAQAANQAADRVDVLAQPHAAMPAVGAPPLPLPSSPPPPPLSIDGSSGAKGSALRSEAEAVYRADLAHRPLNLWALNGLVACRRAQARGRLAASTASHTTAVAADGAASDAFIVDVSDACNTSAGVARAAEHFSEAKLAELAELEALAASAAARADVVVTASCFCALSAGAALPVPPVEAAVGTASSSPRATTATAQEAAATVDPLGEIPPAEQINACDCTS